MPAEDPAAIERRMYVDMVLGGVDDLSYSMSDLKNLTGGGANAHRSAVSGASQSSTGGSNVKEYRITDAEYEVTGAGDYVAEVNTTLTFPSDNTLSLMAYEYVCVRSFDGVLWVSSVGTFYATGGGGAPDDIDITPTAPTVNDVADTYTIPALITGVAGYYVGGVLKAPGVHSHSNTDTDVVVTATASSGYNLLTSMWTLNFTYTAPAGLTPEEAALALTPFYYFPLDDTLGTTVPRNLGSRTIVPVGITGSPVFGGADIGGHSNSVQLVDNSCIQMPDAGAWDGTMTNFFVSILVQPSQIADGILVALNGYTGGGSKVSILSLQVLSNTWYVAVLGNAGYATSPASTASPTLLTIVRDGATSYLYKNGIQVSSIATGANAINPPWPAQGGATYAPIIIGSNASNGFNGQACEFIFGKTVPSLSQIEDLARANGVMI